MSGAIPSREYFTQPRADVLALIGGRELEVLELGCAEGRLGEALKASGIARRVTGVEGFPAAAAAARGRLDDVFEADLDRGLPPLPAATFDLAICADVLEHLREPWTVLAAVVAALKPGGRVVVSLPNLKDFRVLARLALRDDFTYRAQGVMDRTHLRFFTATTAHRLLEGAGLVVERRVFRPPPSRIGRALHTLTMHLLPSFFTEQVQFVARKPGP